MPLAFMQEDFLVQNLYPKEWVEVNSMFGVDVFCMGGKSPFLNVRSAPKPVK